MNRILKNLLLTALTLGLSMGSALADEKLKPFTLGSKGPGTVAEKVAAAKTALQTNGFTIAGSYSPYPETTIIVVTNDEMKTTAAKTENGGFGAAQRVAVTKVGNDVQVSYTTPAYMANGYRMASELPQTSEKLKAALGSVEEFGAKGLTASKLRKYHYMFGMEYFDEPVTLAEYGSYEEAVKAVEANLAAGKGGCTKVYRVDVTGKKESVFGVAMKGGDKYMDDKYIMGQIDSEDLKGSAHLPHEMLVTGNKVIALYARFRIALDFPDLKMSGSNSFMKIMESPEAIKKAMTQAAGGKE
ncbi:hypothetical protein SCD_n00807 [Sulfuricella denitrificans skB26]|uniref:Uncharacterized protein n=1 Tax=Sulfuricella denitrificans (strain DSM 22764 / NBRC 105220 / skB26) TaxID=1163617 RepID=S6ABF2_SULDS|nr:hypothetical protein [Sulfuricella denitrificans]BAN34648.1 hypothetical protein SCD_n00807 [Sulfuricella denitrificans skB26]